MKNILYFCVIVLLSTELTYCQETGYSFTLKKEVAYTPVKNQYSSPTCWSFSGMSFLESEIMRNGNKAYDLSEMYVVRETYKRKAEEFIKRKGETSFAGGGEYQDLLCTSREFGIVPDQIYPGLNYGEVRHNHDEMDAVLKGYMEGLIKSPKLTPAWFPAFNGILDAYLGKEPNQFDYDGKTYTPESFIKETGIDLDDYVIFSSFNDKDPYKEFVLKDVPENWTPSICYNLPLDELIQVIDNALMNDYSVAWASGIEDKGFSMKRGVAIVPEKPFSKMSDEEKKEVFNGPHPEKKINQEVRQKAFENSEVTGDHGMHIVGIAEDQNGNTFYKVKNSWGEVGKYNGFIFVSKAFVMLKTTTCMVNKKAIPEAIAQKMGINSTGNAPGNNFVAADETKEKQETNIAPIPASSSDN